MNLTDYRKKHNLSVIQFAKQLNITRQHLYTIESGSNIPSRKLALEIERLSNGELKAMELLRLNEPKTT